MDCTICANEVSRRAGFSASAFPGPGLPGTRTLKPFETVEGALSGRFKLQSAFQIFESWATVQALFSRWRLESTREVDPRPEMDGSVPG